MPLLLTVSCFSKIQSGFTFLVPADLGSAGKGPLNGCVFVCASTTHPMGHGRQYVYDLSIRLYVRPCLGGGILWLACSGLLVNIAFRNHTFIIHALQCTLHLRLKNWPCYIIPHYVMCCCFCLQCFNAVGWAAARASSLSKMSGGCWRGYLSGARCRFAYGIADATATCFSKIQIGLPFWY